MATVMRQTPGCRDYDDRDVSDEVLYRVLDNARFAPSGGNRQGWRVVVIRDADTRQRLRDLYLEPWNEYVAGHYGTPEQRSPKQHRIVTDATRMAETMHEVPVHLAVWVRMDLVAVTDADADRPSVVAGGSVFPFIQNLLLAARDEGLGTRLTTLLSTCEDEVRSLLDAPEGLALAALVLVGWPQRLPTRLNRRPVEAFTVQERFGGAPFGPRS
jgi:nitroreductase